MGIKIHIFMIGLNISQIILMMIQVTIMVLFNIQVTFMILMILRLNFRQIIQRASLVCLSSDYYQFSLFYCAYLPVIGKQKESPNWVRETYRQNVESIKY